MKKISTLGLLLLILLQGNTQAQTTATYGTVVTSLSTTSVTTATGDTFAIPGSYSAILTWQVTAVGSSAINVVLQGSLDNSTFFTLDTSTAIAGEIRNFGFTGVKFARINLVSRTGAGTTTGTIVTSRGFITSQGSGSLSSLSLTGPLTSTGQFLGKDGTSASPTYSFSSTPTTGLYLASGKLRASILGNSNAFTLNATELDVQTFLGFLTPTTFAALSSASNGTITFCSDCTVTTAASCPGTVASCVCAGSGTGAFARRVNGAWYCTP